MVTANSPEAMEEPLWTSYFAWLHDPARSALPSTRAIRLLRRPIAPICPRSSICAVATVTSKNNYLLARLPILARFPDARVVVPVRAPVIHIAFMRQQARFIEAAAADPRTAAYMRHSRI